MVRDAWERGQELTVHGWCYGLKDGLARDLKTSVTGPAEMSAVYKSALENI